MRMQSYQGCFKFNHLNLTRSKEMNVKSRPAYVAEIVDEVAITAMSLAIVLSVPLFMLTSI
jgi:hypothetical protein